LKLATRRAHFLAATGTNLTALMHSRGIPGMYACVCVCVCVCMPNHPLAVYIDEIAVGAVIEPNIVLNTLTVSAVKVCVCDHDDKRFVYTIVIYYLLCSGAMTLVPCLDEGKNACISFITRYDAHMLNELMNKATMME
jgi:hypothetical protein